MKKSTKKKSITLLSTALLGGAFALSMPYNVYASAPPITSIQTFGGTGSDTLNAVKPTADGGYVVVGSSDSNDGDLAGMKLGSTDALIVKFDAYGSVQWKKMFGGVSADTFTSVFPTLDGGYVAAGNSSSTSGDMTGLNKGIQDAILVKFDSLGNVQWKKNFGGANNDTFSGIQQTSDGSFVAVGNSNSNDGDLTNLHNGTTSYYDAIIVKFDPSGNVTWKKNFGGSVTDSFSSVYPTTDGGYVAAGSASSNDGDLTGFHYGTTGFSDAIIAKFDASGAVQWVRNIGGTLVDQFYSVVQTKDHGYVAVGSESSSDFNFADTNKGSVDGFVSKFDESGNLMWVKNFGGTGSDAFNAVQESKNGGFIVSAKSSSTNLDMNGLNKGLQDGVLLQYDALGNVVWMMNIGGTASDNVAYAQQANNGDIIAVGVTSSTNGDFAGLSKGSQDGFIARIARVGPSVPVLTSQTGTVYTNKLPTLSGTGEAGSTVSIMANDTLSLATVPVDGSGNWSWTPQAAIDGSYAITLYATDVKGNQSDISALQVTFVLDRVAPVQATFTPDNTLPTNSNVTVTVTYPGDAAVKEYRTNGGAWTAYNSPVVMTDNGTVEARSSDSAGNISEIASYSVTNFDNIAPGFATFTADKTDLTNSDVTVTVVYPSDVTLKEYRINSEDWMTYTGAIVISNNNDRIYARSSDAAINQSPTTSYEVTNIDKIAPTTPSAKVVGDKLAVTPGTDASGIQKTEYQLNGGAWTTYTSEVTLTDGIYTINVRSIDNAGNFNQVMMNATVTVQALTQASEAVAQAEYSKTQMSVDLARQALSALPASSDKDVMNDRLDVVQQEINSAKALASATAAVTSVETSKSQADVDSTRTLVNALPAGATKDALNNRLNAVQAEIDAIQTATSAVAQAETDKIQASVDSAKALVNALPVSTSKNALTTRLDTVQTEIDAVKAVQALQIVKDAVTLAESTHKQLDYNNALEVLNTLPNSADKDAIKSRLDEVKSQMDKEARAIQALENANKQVETAQQFKTNYNVEKAQQAIDVLPNGADKTALQARLDEVKRQMAEESYQEQLAKATAKVGQAEQYKRDPYLTDAKNLMSALRDGADKQALQVRLNAIKTTTVDTGYPDLDGIADASVRNTLLNVTKSIERGEKYFLKGNIVYALGKVAEISESIKNDDRYKAIVQKLSDRVNFLKNTYNQSLVDKALQQAIDKANSDVEMYEKYKTAYYKNRAVTSVNALADGSNKAGLQSRIDEVVVK